MVAHRSGTSGAWSVTSLDGSGQGTDEAIGRDPSSITFGGKLYIFYTAGDGLGLEELRAAVYDGATWTYQLLDGYGGASGRIEGKLRAPAAVVHDGKLRVYYVDDTNDNIREAVTSNGTSWSFSVLDGDGGPNGRTTDRLTGDISPVVYGPVFQPKLQIFYQNNDEVRLRVAELEGGQFHFHDINGDGGIASGAVDDYIRPWSSAVSYAKIRFGAETPYVFYVDMGNRTLRVASKAGSSWSALTLDGAGSGSACAGATSTPILGPVTAIVDSEGIRVFYTAWNHTLRHARFTP
ncbi:hypothetical protein [Sorangium sp. So ce1024]|uniref:hypothetical protein n=1 Tax=Sorangium sp. So ce1024 TaxID=3133327 RepID=UPI003F0C59E8